MKGKEKNELFKLPLPHNLKKNLKSSTNALEFLEIQYCAIKMSLENISKTGFCCLKDLPEGTLRKMHFYNTPTPQP